MHFDKEIQMAEPEGIKIVNITPQVDRFELLYGLGVISLANGRLPNLCFATGHPSLSS